MSLQKINETQNKAAKEVKRDPKGFNADKNCDKMAKNSYLSILTLNTNELNFLIKRYRVSELI